MFDNLVDGFKKNIRAPILYKLREIDWYRRWSQLPSNDITNIGDFLSARKPNDASTCKQIHQPHTIKVKRPSNKANLHPVFERMPVFESPATFVARLRDCRFFGRGVAVVTPDQQVLSDVTIHIGGTVREHTIMRLFKMPLLENLEGTTAILYCPGGNTYYHWLFDLLPRLKLIQLAGRNLDEIDRFVVNSVRSSFQKDTLKLAGIDDARVIQSDRARYFLCEDMILPSYPGITLHPLKWVCDYLVETLLPKTPSENVPTAPKLYIPRRNVPRRRILNQDELESFLLKRGFKTFDPAEYTVPQQARAFNQADVIVAPHGSGLSNLVFCKPGTTVIELFPPSVMPLCYWILSSQMDLNYYYHIGTESSGSNKRSDFAIDLAELTRLIKEAGI